MFKAFLYVSSLLFILSRIMFKPIEDINLTLGGDVRVWTGPGGTHLTDHLPPAVREPHLGPEY